ncbi:MAG: GNAT family N-acetyltransferase [Candidatus Limnocylindrales bacterium]
MTASHDQVVEAADTLARAMADEPFSRWLLPDPDEFRAVHRELYAALIRLALDEGRVDTWGEPIVGVAVWLVRPPISEIAAPTARAKRRLPDVFPAHATERVERYSAVIRRLRERVRPQRHAYLDTMAVLPEHRRRGIASRLLEAGHAWADAAGLPCALDTETVRNTAFYERRGYRTVARLQVPGSDLTVSGMRRRGGA